MNGLAGSNAGNSVTLTGAAFGMLLAFVLGQLAAWVYMYTHAGISYSRSFVQSIILLTVIISLSMMVIGNNIIVAFGLIGALAVIRFRNVLKDTRDTAFIFFALIVGMAAGTHAYMLAIWGTAAFCAVLFYLHWTDFGSRHTGDGFLRFNVAPNEVDQTLLESSLRRHCRSIQLLSTRLHESGNTIIVVTHEEHVARCSHRIIHFRDGSIESDDRRTAGERAS